MSILLHSSWCRVNSGPNWLTIHKTFLREKRGTARWLFPGGKLRSLWALSAPWDGLSCHIQRPGSVCGPQLPHQRPRQWQAGHPGRLPKGSPTCCKGSLEGTCPQATWRLLAVEDTEIQGIWSLGWHSPRSACGAAIAASSCNGGGAAWSDRDLGMSTSCRSARSQPLDPGGCWTTALAGALFTPAARTCVISSGGLCVAPGEAVAMPLTHLQSWLPPSSRTGKSYVRKCFRVVVAFGHSVFHFRNGICFPSW